MARGDSVIRVSIIGDASKLLKAIGKADAATGGLIGSTGRLVGGALLAGGAIDKIFDITKTALDNADKFNDALDRLKGLTTPEFAQHIKDIAFNMTNIGLSAPEVADLAANFAAFATAAKVSQPTIEAITPDLLKIAAAVAATTGKTVDEVINDIGRAAGGNKKSVADLGIVVDKTLNPDDQILSILDQLKKKFPDVITATDDLAGSQDKLGAKWDNFTTKLGLALEGPLKGVVDWLNTNAEQLPAIGTSFADLGKGIHDFAQGAVDALKPLLDAIENIRFGLTHIFEDTTPFQVSPGRASRRGPGGGTSESQLADAIRRQQERAGRGGVP